MKKKFAIASFTAMVATFIIGLIFLFSSGKVGRSVGDGVLHSNGGSMNTSSYERIVDTTTTNFQIGGGILSMIGGFGLLLSGYIIYKEI